MQLNARAQGTSIIVWKIWKINTKYRFFVLVLPGRNLAWTRSKCTTADHFRFREILGRAAIAPRIVFLLFFSICEIQQIRRYSSNFFFIIILDLDLYAFAYFLQFVALRFARKSPNTFYNITNENTTNFRSLISVWQDPCIIVNIFITYREIKDLRKTLSTRCI